MTIHETLKKYYGYDNFRGGQESLIEAILEYKDVVGIMPTGAGKSICFQLPAILLEGMTLVISPLISLMKDQVQALSQLGIAASFVNSTLSEREIAYTLQMAADGAYKLLYIAPERLFSPDFLAFSKHAHIAMLAVDEAHCISHWGQDFRPSYSKIPEFVNSLPLRPILSAFTATATKIVKDDIVKKLNLIEPKILITGFDRKNLYFAVKKPKNKFNELISFLEDKKEKSGIIYCSTRKSVEEVCDKLNDAGFKASRYHAGLSDIERHNNQEDFLYDRIQIMVATNAFGMGIDKSNVSFVVHYNMPKDIESYYQEAGRAGRDGASAECLLLYSGQDVRTNSWLIENTGNRDHLDPETEALIKEQDRTRLREMTFYSTGTGCLRQHILKYFGEQNPDYCGNCSNCESNFETSDVTIESQKILSCVGRMRGRYGAQTVIDVLKGSKKEKIIKQGLDNLSTYGISQKSDKELLSIINHLIYNNYLYKTSDEYPTLKLTDDSKKVLREGQTIKMKIQKELKAETETLKQNDTVRIFPVNNELFAHLKELRFQVANEERVPAFVIFTDSTLIDICMKLPKSKTELLQVSGIGQIKLERYGERFLKAIEDFNATNSIEEISSDELKPLDIRDIELSEDPLLVTAFTDRINSVIIQSGYKKLVARKINEWLVEEEYLHITNVNGRNYKYPTQKGRELGILTEERMINSERRILNFFPRNVQEFIIENILSKKWDCKI